MILFGVDSVHGVETSSCIVIIILEQRVSGNN